LTDLVDDTNGELYEEEKEGNDEDLDLKQVAETQ